MYRLGLRLRRERRYADAAECWRRLIEMKEPVARRTLAHRSLGEGGLLGPLRQYAAEALAIHHEHRERDYEGARELTLQLLDDSDEDATRHRLARLERKLAKKRDSHLFDGCQ